jgi:hypothetical protein
MAIHRFMAENSPKIGDLEHAPEKACLLAADPADCPSGKREAFAREIMPKKS